MIADVARELNCSLDEAEREVLRRMKTGALPFYAQRTPSGPHELIPIEELQDVTSIKFKPPQQPMPLDEVPKTPEELAAKADKLELTIDSFLKYTGLTVEEFQNECRAGRLIARGKNSIERGWIITGVSVADFMQWQNRPDLPSAVMDKILAMQERQREPRH
jgi:hypothetical protein